MTRHTQAVECCPSMVQSSTGAVDAAQEAVTVAEAKCLEVIPRAVQHASRSHQRAFGAGQQECRGGS